jgi:hypothetical protein
LSKRFNKWVGIAALAAGTITCALAVVLVTGLQVHLDGDFLHVTAPHLNFLNGKALERLKDGASVAFIGQLSITSNPSAVVDEGRSVARFALSYDIWEERFSVSRFGDRPGQHRSISHLSAPAAEAWCLDNMMVDKALIPADRPFYVRLDLRADDPRDELGIVGDTGINITRLIEIFSRPVKGNQQHWFRDAGPFKLAELRKASHE